MEAAEYQVIQLAQKQNKERKKIMKEIKMLKTQQSSGVESQVNSLD